jgi:hypothetical protein
MARETGQPVERVAPAEAYSWFLESLPERDFNAVVLATRGPENPDEPMQTGDPWFDEEERRALERKRQKGGG